MKKVLILVLLLLTASGGVRAIHLSSETTGGWLQTNLVTAAVCSNEYVFIGTPLGVYMFRPDTGEKKHLTREKGMISNHVTSLDYSVTQNVLVVGTSSGISLYSPVEDRVVSLTMADGLFNNEVMNVYVDDISRQLFVSLFGGRVSVTELDGLNPPGFDTYQTGGGSVRLVSSVCVSDFNRDPAGRIWHGTNASGVYIHYPSHEWDSFPEALKGLWVTGIEYLAPGGPMYIATSDGLYQCSMEDPSDPTAVDSFRDFWVRDMGRHHGQLVLGTTDGLYTLRNGDRIDVTEQYWLKSRDISVVESRGGILLVGTRDDGLYIFDFPFPRVAMLSSRRPEEESYDKKSFIASYEIQEDKTVLTALAESLGLVLAEDDQDQGLLLFTSGQEIDVQSIMEELLALVTASGTVKREVTISKNRYLYPVYTPLDPYYQTQHRYLFQTRVEEVWNEYAGTGEKRPIDGRDITVAVVDTGVSDKHRDLSENVLRGASFDFLSPKSARDDHFHGTFCAGIVAALADNYEGIRGLVSRVSILPVKSLNRFGYGTSWSVGQGISYAADEGADIISLSLGSSEYCPVIHRAIKYAYHEKGCVVVAAAGNENSKYSHYPSAFHEVLSVVSVDDGGRRSVFSNYGAQADVAAPGEDIISTVHDGRYMVGSGTSFACPHVAAQAAMILSYNSGLSNEQVNSIIAASSGAAGPPVWKANLGYGVIDFKRALQMARNGSSGISHFDEKKRRVTLSEDKKLTYPGSPDE